MLICLCRLALNVTEQEHEEIVWDVINTEEVFGRVWQVVSFRMGDRNMSSRSIPFVKGELSFIFDYIKMVKMSEATKRPRDLIPGRLQRLPRPVEDPHNRPEFQAPLKTPPK